MPFRELRNRSGLKEPLRELRSADNVERDVAFLGEE
jgi:hypothetical protein